VHLPGHQQQAPIDQQVATRPARKYGGTVYTQRPSGRPASPKHAYAVTDTAWTDRLPEIFPVSFGSPRGFVRAATLVLALATAPLGSSLAQLVKDLPKGEGLVQPPLDTDSRRNIRDFSDPAVTITNRENHEIREYRSGNRVYTKVTPRNSPPYYLVDEDGSGNMQWRRNSLERSAPAKWSVLKW